MPVGVEKEVEWEPEQVSDARWGRKRGGAGTRADV
jgi:hypothetical protein